jgi:hypothetical protein
MIRISNRRRCLIARTQFANLPGIPAEILSQIFNIGFEKPGQLMGMVGIRWSLLTLMGSTQMQQSSASGRMRRRCKSIDSRDPSLPILPKPNSPRRQIRRFPMAEDLTALACPARTLAWRECPNMA